MALSPDVKVEPPSPPKKLCLNTHLLKPKEEKQTTPRRQAAPAAVVSPGQAAPAKAKTPKSKPAMPSASSWQHKLKATPSKFVISLGTPTPPRNNKRPADDLQEPAHRHVRPPPPPPASSPPPGAGCDIQAEPAEPRGDTGGTGSCPGKGKARGKCSTSEIKRIHNAFDYRLKDLQKEPELLQHLHDLIEHHKKGSPVILEYKKAIGDAKGGKVDTPFLNAVKKRILVKKWGQETELGSWKQVLGRLGNNVAYAALRQGTLPYVPHSLLLPNHGVKWPESHEFVLTKKYWHEHWKQEVAFDDEDPAATQQAIDEFLSNPEAQCEEHTSRTELNATVMTGIPNGETMETPEPAAPAATNVSVKSEFERSAHPEFCGVKYDELHSSTVKNMQKVIQQ